MPSFANWGFYKLPPGPTLILTAAGRPVSEATMFRMLMGLVLMAYLTQPFQAQAAELQIGYVNLQRAILEVEEGKRAKNSLRAEFERKQKELSQREAELKKLKDTLEREAGTKNDPSLNAKQLEFQNKLVELQQIFMKEQQALQASEQKELGAITTKMRKIIDGLGKQGSYTLILEGNDSRLLFAKPHLDLTNEVIRNYNSKHK